MVKAVSRSRNVPPATAAAAAAAQRALTLRTAYMRSRSPVLLVLNTWLLSEKSRWGGCAAAGGAWDPLPVLRPAC